LLDNQLKIFPTITTRDHRPLVTTMRAVMESSQRPPSGYRMKSDPLHNLEYWGGDIRASAQSPGLTHGITHGTNARHQLPDPAFPERPKEIQEHKAKIDDTSKEIASTVISRILHARELEILGYQNPS